tara:strand:+ start:2203 stop:2898 length:696 start_codon:yes stop_codon:yes gene_type:complete
MEFFEVFMLRRNSGSAFAAGMYVFPGGRVEGDDHLHKYDERRQGPSEAQITQKIALGNEWRGYWIAGIRESFEEAGLLLAYRSDGSLIEFSDPAVDLRFKRYRDLLNSGAMSLLDICKVEDLKLAVDRMHFHNRFVTPFGRPRRFDTRFFIAEAPLEQAGQHDREETVDSVWISPEKALKMNDEDELGLMGVTRHQLEYLAKHDSKDSILKAASAKTRFPTRRPKLEKRSS